MKNKKTMYLKKSVPFKVFLTEDVCTFQVNDVNMDLKNLDFCDVSLWFKFRGIIALLVKNALRYLFENLSNLFYEIKRGMC